MLEPREITGVELRQQILPWIPRGLDPDEVAKGVALALVPPGERTYPLVSNPFRRDRLYAWSETDASAVRLALGLLGEIARAVLTGGVDLLSVGVALHEVVTFLIELKRHHVTVIDKLHIKLLLLLRDADGGLSASQILDRLGRGAPPLAEIEQALLDLEHATSEAGPRPLVRRDRMIWKYAL